MAAFLLQGARDYLAGRTNNNSVDLNRDFPDLDTIMYINEERHTSRNNHLMELLQSLDYQVGDRQVWKESWQVWQER